MELFRMLTVLLIVTGTNAVVGSYLLSSSAQQAPSYSAAPFPKDVFAETGNRLPPVKRDELDETGKKLYDARPGLVFGPEGMRLYSPPAAASFEEMNDYLRKKSG